MKPQAGHLEFVISRMDGRLYCELRVQALQILLAHLGAEQSMASLCWRQRLCTNTQVPAGVIDPRHIEGMMDRGLSVSLPSSEALQAALTAHLTAARGRENPEGAQASGQHASSAQQDDVLSEHGSAASAESLASTGTPPDLALEAAHSNSIAGPPSGMHAGPENACERSSSPHAEPHVAQPLAASFHETAAQQNVYSNDLFEPLQQRTMSPYDHAVGESQHLSAEGPQLQFFEADTAEHIACQASHAQRGSPIAAMLGSADAPASAPLMSAPATLIFPGFAPASADPALRAPAAGSVTGQGDAGMSGLEEFLEALGEEDQEQPHLIGAYWPEAPAEAEAEAQAAASGQLSQTLSLLGFGPQQEAVSSRQDPDNTLKETGRAEQVTGSCRGGAAEIYSSPSAKASRGSDRGAFRILRPSLSPLFASQKGSSADAQLMVSPPAEWC